ncbi:MAG: DEAD/DEAH box helicase [Candidatus Thermoplasmatota archaeon]|nr:DEAD/DEAH box helicase [Candidatus Thermoplasmatota archaeon]
MSVVRRLHPRLQEIIRTEGLEELTLPQERAIPPILEGKHCLLIAPTGMGKTEAALLPLFHQILCQGKQRGVSVLYITPLRALNRDMLRRTLTWGRQLGLDIAVRHGDTTQKERQRQSLHPPDLLITTPETLQIMFTGKRLRKSLEDVRWVVIDEVHELAGIERGAQLAVALERLQEVAGGFQRIGLSATVGTPETVAAFLGGGREVAIVEAAGQKGMEVAVEAPSPTGDDHRLAARLGCDPRTAASVRRAREIIDAHASVLLFVNTRDTAELLASFLHEMGASIEVHHGSLSREARIEAEEKFKAGEVKALICTSSLELGIDVGQTDFVIQYNSPRQVTRLVQRIGRSEHHVGGTARGSILATNPEDLAEARVIARRAMAGELEETAIRPAPLAVLANQIMATATEYGRIESQRLYHMITRAYPFHFLSRETLEAVLEQLHRQRTIWYENGVITRKRRSRQYFLENISMIPDERSVEVIDISANRPLGTLDESFVLNSCEEGSQFIMKGRAWEVVRHDERLVVAPARRTSIVPDWSGEEIPVPFEVAREVGEMRASSHADDSLVGQQVVEQRERGFEVPTHRRWTVEGGGDTVYITTHCGSRTNEALGRVIAALLAQQRGQSVGMDADPYRIYLRVAHPLDPGQVTTLLNTVDPDSLGSLVRIILRNSSFIRWELVKVARKFGVLGRDMDISSFSPDKLLDVFAGQPLLQEVIDRVVWDQMDLEHARQALREAQTGILDLVVQRVSPMSRAAEAMRGEVFRPSGVDDAVLASLKKRLEKTPLTLTCMNCGYRWSTTVGRASPSCPKCSGKMISVTTGRHGKSTSGGALKTASLVASYGSKAFLVLAGYGIGPDTAARVLATQKEGNDLLREILEAEVTYSRTRQFWD